MPLAETLGDFNGDGKLDLATVSASPGNTLRVMAAQVQRTLMDLSRTDNVGLAAVRLERIASEIPFGLQQLAPVWERAGRGGQGRRRR